MIIVAGAVFRSRIVGIATRANSLPFLYDSVSYLEEYDTDDLRRLLAKVNGRESTQQLMIALAYKDGESIPTLADRYGLSQSAIETWFRRLDEEPIEDAIVGIERLSLSHRAKTPVGSGTDATVEFLNYDVVRREGWDLDDPALFEKAARTALPPEDHGRLSVAPDQSVLDAVAEAELEWPHACNGGACSNCAVYVTDGSVAMSGDHVLPDDLVRDGNVRLACVATPTTDEMKLVYGVRHLDVLQDLLLPAEGFDIPSA
jgi:ferredoxin